MNLDSTFLPVGHAAAPVGDVRWLQIGGYQHASWVAGPGKRSVVWVAGCHRRCPGCIKPEWLDFTAGQRVSVGYLADVLNAVEGSAGVSFSGGEPFEQAAAVAFLAKMVRQTGRTVLVYTGYRHELLAESRVEAIQELLRQTDILIDGEYRAELRDAGGWRGSSNQRIIPLTAAGAKALEADRCKPRGDVQLVVTDQTVRITGCPDHSFLDRMIAELGSRGVTLRGVANR